MTTRPVRRGWEQLGTLAALGALVVADVAVPSVQSNRPPALPDLLAGLALLWCGADLLWAPTARRTGLLLCGAGVAWFLPDLAVTGRPVLDRGLAALSLVHVPMLVTALLRTPRDRLSGTTSRAAVGASVLAAVTGATGGYAVALPATGLLLLVALGRAWHRAGRARSRSWGAYLSASAAYGLVLVVAPLVRLVGAVEVWLPTVYDATVAGAAMALVSTGSWLQPTRAVDVGPGGLGQVDALVAEAVGHAAAHAIVRVPEIGWLDLHGRQVHHGPSIAIDDTVAVSVSGPAGSAPEAGPGGRPSAALLDPTLRECLMLAARNVRLRAESAARLDDLALLRRRLVVVEDDERRAIVDRLRAGPLTRLEGLRDDLTRAGLPDQLVLGVERTQVALRDLAQGLDPLAPTGSLDHALRELVRRRPGPTTFTSHPVAVDRAAAHTLWFACAEILANATKHAPGAAAVVRLETVAGLAVLTVADDGPGTVVVEGSGLRGVRDRVTSTGGTYHLESGAAGTTVSVAVPTVGRRAEPTADTRQHVDRSGAHPDVSDRTPLLASSQPTRTEQP